PRQEPGKAVEASMTSSMKFAVSSTAFRKQPLETIVETVRREQFCLEFSSGLPPRSDMAEFFVAATVPRLPHNYFPAPDVPFVLNLASMKPAIRQRSIEHCIQGVRLAQKVGAPFYSAHAGFCVDAKPSDLGQKISLEVTAPREDFWRLFIDAVGLV